ncbi:MAG: hypothetical protein AB3N19_16420 [Ruegeria sp.]
MTLSPLPVAGADALKERPFKTRVIQSGHSLTDPVFEPLESFVRVSGFRGAQIDKSTIPGAPMSWRWDHEPGYGLPDAKSDIGDYDLLVLTEGVSMSLTLPHHRSDEMALKWFNNTWENGNNGEGAETILYASWVHVTSGPEFENPYVDPEGNIPFRERMPLEMERWQYVRDYVNENRPQGSPPMQMIPGPLIMAQAYDDIKAGKAPGLTDIKELFSDDIHVNGKGAYLISLAHFMVIYGKDPRTLPPSSGRDGSPTREQAIWMQELVWDVVSEYVAKHG